ncbi:unnamed protein product, partial [Closterium sp. Naga37s-1]
MKHAERLDSEVIYDRDFDYDYFGFKTLERSYLLKVNGKVVERPQHMLMRVAVGIHKADIEAAVQTYHLMSQRWFTHASPTLFNSGTPRPQLSSSCLLVCMKEDSIEGIYDTLKECAVISKSAGGIGLSAHCIRAKGSYIRGTNGMSNGIVPMLRVFNDMARYVDQGGGKRKVRYVDQGGGKRKGAFAIYIEPWHSDMFDFLDLRERDLFYGIWIPDLFMQRVQSNMPWSLFCPNEPPGLAASHPNFSYPPSSRPPPLPHATNARPISPTSNMPWSLFCPNEAPGLADCWGEEFEALYLRYEREGRAKRVIPSQKLWFAICEAQIETGNPYMLFKDACNRKSNQQNLGTIKCSNLCTEIVEFTSPEETAVCNLVSIALPRFVREKGMPSEAHPSKLTGSLNHDQRFFDFEKLGEITEVVTCNLNRVIDVNYYPTESARRSNMRHRPIGLGVQGLADAFILLGMPFDSPQARQLNRDIFETIYYHALRTSCQLVHLYLSVARQLNRDIFETIYYHALRTSCQLAKEEGTYESYAGCPVSKGILQPDMWGVTPSDRWDWAALREDIATHGLRNSLLVAPMPTASTSQILGNNECFEPYTSNIYSRRVLSGEFVVVNKHLLSDLTHLGLWLPDLKNEIMYRNGSVEGIDEIPQHLRDIYKTVWELKQRAIVDMAADRGAFIDQSQSLNIHMDAPTFGKLTSLHFYTWGKGLKTGMYYLRTRGAADAIKFTVDAEAAKR